MVCFEDRKSVALPIMLVVVPLEQLGGFFAFSGPNSPDICVPENIDGVWR